MEALSSEEVQSKLDMALQYMGSANLPAGTPPEAAKLLEANRNTYQALRSGDIFEISDASAEEQKAQVDLFQMNVRLGREVREKDLQEYTEAVGADEDAAQVLEAAVEVVGAGSYLYASEKDYESLNQLYEIAETERQDAKKAENPQRRGIPLQKEQRKTSSLVLDPVQTLLITVDLLEAVHMNPALLNGGELQ
jgi:hypothetical protein